MNVCDEGLEHPILYASKNLLTDLLRKKILKTIKSCNANLLNQN